MTKYNKRKRTQKIKNALGVAVLSVLVGFTGCIWAYAYSSQIIQKQSKC